MPHFFIETYDGQTATTDSTGSNYPGPEAAFAEAMRRLPDMPRDPLPDGEQRDFTVIVRDVAGHALYTVAFSLAVGRKR